MAQPDILVFLHNFDPGGVETSALRMAKVWQDLGAPVRVVVGLDDGPLRDRIDLPRYETFPKPRLFARQLKSIRMIARLPAVIRQHRPDIIFCPGNAYAVVAVALRLLLRDRCPQIVLKISNDLQRPDMPLPLRHAYYAWLRVQGATLDHFAGLADETRGEIQQRANVAAGRIAIVKDASIAAARITELRAMRRAHYKPGQGRHYLAIGRLVRQKNFATLVKAFALIAGPDDRLTILGEGPCRAAIERQIHAMALETRVELPGFRDPALALATADSFVLSSHYEGIPGVVIEALAAGIPIVATDCSVGMSDLLDHGGLGRLVASSDPLSLAEAMRAPALPSGNSDAGRQRAAEYAVETASRHYLKLFRRIHAGSSVQVRAHLGRYGDARTINRASREPEPVPQSKKSVPLERGLR